MKEIPDKKFDDKDSACSLLKQCLDAPPMPGGFDITIVRARNRVADAIEATKDGVLKLEDADYVTAQEAMKQTRWGTRSKNLDEFYKLFGL